ncbi:MAG: bifunctional metallophosphatase/5'-nucleotidase [Chitinophagaceae bacterium]|nr:bifunctional metallophosphatase/5'-nucleotidase [Chitinophagaceae bacterium]
MRKFNVSVLIVVLFLLSACSSTQKSTGVKDDGKLDFTIVQINDVYEIAPLDGGKWGGMARVATVKKEYLKENPNTFMALAGDFLSPSVYNSLKYEGNRIRGKQMVDAMNVAGVDLVVFGNHEFDIAETDVQSRINESNFKWISTNTFHKTDKGISPFVKQTKEGDERFPESYIMELKDADGTTAKIGYIGLTLPFTKVPYVSYTDVFTSAQKKYDELKDQCDAVIAITHQTMENDIKLAKEIPGLTLIIGGHEHERHYAKIGNVYITKADANAKSAYILKLNINKKNQQVSVAAKIIDINESTPFDAATDIVVKKWTDIGNANYASLGFDATKICMATGKPLDGREPYTRTTKTNFTEMIVAAMEKASPTADIAIMNSGAIRVDDILQMPVTQYDIIRSLPFGGSIMEVEMKGSLLIKVLEAGKNNVGSGGFLQYSSSIMKDSVTNNWTFKNAPFDINKVYKVAISDFLMTGGEANLGFLQKIILIL